MLNAKNKLEYFRRINFLTQAELAEKLGMSSAGYNKIENGDRRLSIEVALKLVKLYKLEKIEDLLEDELLKSVAS